MNVIGKMTDATLVTQMSLLGMGNRNLSHKKLITHVDELINLSNTCHEMYVDPIAGGKPASNGQLLYWFYSIALFDRSDQ